jgi:hypothetical protein
MKAFLLHPDRDFDVKPALRDEMFEAMLSGNLFALSNVRRDRERRLRSAPPPPPGLDDALTQDLELGTLWTAMAAGDEFLFETAKRAVLSSLYDAEAIVYRQRVLADCLGQPAIIRLLYELAMEALAPRSILLGNESFASTNEREGSEIARQVISAMLDKQIKVFFVTHMYELAHGFYSQLPGAALFLRAERKPDGRRTFKLVEGGPLPTSYGEDSYRRIFDTAGTTPAAASTNR